MGRACFRVAASIATSALRMRFADFSFFRTRLRLPILGLAVWLGNIAGGAWAHDDLEKRFADLFVQVEKHPDDPSLYYQLADLRCQHGDWAATLACLQEVERLAPGKYATEPLRGQAFALGGRPKEALESYDRFLTQHPESVRVYVFRARLKKEQGDAAGWLMDLESAVSRAAQPEPDLVIELAEALGASRRGADGVGYLDKAMEVVGTTPSLVKCAIGLELADGRYDAAINRVMRMERLAPRAEPWIAERARISTQAQRPEDARAAWEELLASIAMAPPAIRSSHAMNLLAEQARNGLAGR